MCGIGGFVDFGGAKPARAVLERMASTLKHRGPDSGGIWINGPCGLAHRRLSIIDLKGSTQPMVCSDRGIGISFNGEIYNFKDLRKTLRRKGYTFSTDGDTEALLLGVAQWWENVTLHLNGMFAFAAWDPDKRLLLLARDPVGIKPLFYTVPKPGLLVFGSEIKALLQHPEVEQSLDLDGLRQAYRFRTVYGDGTLYARIKQLPPGHTLGFGEHGVEIKKYFSIADQMDLGTQMCAQDSTRDTIQRGLGILRTAVRKRLMADVPVGCFLSGGVDSSLIAALMVEARGRAQETRTYSVGFANDPHSELPIAQQVATVLDTNHTVVNLTESDYVSSLKRLTEFRDAPLSEPADPALAQMSTIASRDVKVVLSGEGADELFCGYPKYSLASAPKVLNAIARRLGPKKASSIARLLGLDRRKALTVIRALSPPDEIDRIVQWFSELDRTKLGELLPGIGWEDAEWTATTSSQRMACEGFEDHETALKMQVVDCLTWLPGNLLERGDRMTMAAGLEARVPFLDKELVAFSFGLPRHYKLRRGTRKWIVRQWAETLLPAEVARRKKWSFQVPLDTWFRGRMKDSLYGYLTSPSSLGAEFGNMRNIRSLLDSHVSGSIDANRALWTLLTIEIWYQEVFRKRGSN